jgi:hypothetical protein
MSKKIEDRGDYYTIHTQVGNIGDSFFYQTYWYYDNHLLINVVRGERAALNTGWMKYLNDRGIKHEVIGESVVIMPESVEQVFMDEGTFTGGVCEVYVCKQKPTAENVPDKTYTPDDVNFSEDMPKDFMAAFDALGSHVYMSGGEGGINIAHRHKEEIIYFVQDTM